jgi:hypothetical protein
MVPVIRLPVSGRLLMPAVLAVQAFSVAAAQTAALNSYALAAPDRTVVLPARLNEVSGVTAISDTELALVQDEEGVVFVYDLGQQRITRQIRFGPPGDYEDIARVGSRLFVLRSDGTLFEIRGLSGTPPVTIHVLRLPTADNEGLCLDARQSRLLIAPKSRLGQGKNLRDTRAIFTFDPASATLQREPMLMLSIGAVREFVERQAGQASGPAKGKGGKPLPSLQFMPSAVAMHPLTSELFVLSAVDRVLATFDTAGRVTGYAPLVPKLFRQPEGLAFLSNGDLVVTNESAGRQPTLLVFRYGGADGRRGPGEPKVADRP